MNLLEIEKDSSVYEGFIKRVTINKNDCWEVSGPKNGAGYPCIYISTLKTASQTEFTHRYSYELFKGKIPKGLVIDHLCKNKCCANPEHLEAITQSENTTRGDCVEVTKKIHASRLPEERSARAAHASSFNVQRNLNRTHCRRGYEINSENTRIERNGSRRCRICLRISNTKFYSKN